MSAAVEPERTLASEETIRMQAATLSAQNALISELQVENAGLQAANKGLVGQNEALKVENAELKERIEDLEKRLFGKTSEKLDRKKLQAAAEAVIEDQKIAESGPEAPNQEAAKPEREKRKQGKQGGGRKPLPENIPVEEIVLDLPEDQKVCPETGVALVRIKQIVTEELEWVPGHHVRKRYIRYVYAHPQRLFGPVAAPLPPRLLPGSSVGPGLLAHMLIARYVDHIPWARQEAIAARAGVAIERRKLCRWAEDVAELLQGIYRTLKAQLLVGRYLQGDETPVEVIDPDRPGAARKAWMWTYYGPENPAQVVYFEFHLSRGQDSPKAFLPKEWKGVFQSDAYAVYDALCEERPGIVASRCNAHMRRKWVEAIDGGGQVVLDILVHIQKLYRIEREAKALGLEGEKRAAFRQHKGVDIVLDELEKKILAAQQGELPTSRIGKAAKYALDRWEALTLYAKPGYGHVLIDTNPTERNIRPIAMGRRAWLFVGSPDAGEKSAIFYSIFATCRMNKVQPEAYLNWLFPKLAVATTHTVTQLLPHHFAAELAEAQKAETGEPPPAVAAGPPAAAL